MYAQKMAAAINVHGKTAREFDDNVYLPFGSEYSIYLKNLNTVRASVTIEIDGTVVTDGVALVINPGQSYELERFIKGGNLTSGNRFKFIEKTAKVQAHRGNKVDDGIVRITYQFEKQKPPVQYLNQVSGGLHYPKGARGIGPTASAAYVSNSSESFSLSAQAYNYEDANTAGITAPGSISEQQFRTVAPLELELSSHCLVFRLVGEHQGKAVSNVTTTRTVTECISCGTKTRSATAKFCSNCGTSLQLIN